MADKHEKRIRWVQRGDFAVEVEVDVVYPQDAPQKTCLEPQTIRLLDAIAHRAERGDLAYLRRVGRVFQAIPA